MDISNMDDVIDSRDVIARIEELAEEMDANESDPDTYSSEEHETMRSELATLQALADEASQYSEDWQYGETLVRDSYWQDYARQTVEECGYFEQSHVDGGIKVDWNAWPYRCIDWQQVAEELKADYTTVSFDGVDYWIRSV
jgi:hypothetical protein